MAHTHEAKQTPGLEQSPAVSQKTDGKRQDPRQYQAIRHHPQNVRVRGHLRDIKRSYKIGKRREPSLNRKEQRSRAIIAQARAGVSANNRPLRLRSNLPRDSSPIGAFNFSRAFPVWE